MVWQLSTKYLTFYEEQNEVRGNLWYFKICVKDLKKKTMENILIKKIVTSKKNKMGKIVFCNIMSTIVATFKSNLRFYHPHAYSFYLDI